MLTGSRLPDIRGGRTCRRLHARDSSFNGAPKRIGPIRHKFLAIEVCHGCVFDVTNRMPPRPPKSTKKAQVSDQTIASKAKTIVGKVKAQRVDETGLTNRVRGHVSAQTKRTQAKRDAK